MDLRRLQVGIDQHGLPMFAGIAARRILTSAFGLPNAYPRDGETQWDTRRLLFVDDDRGAAVAVWIPRES